MAVELALVHLVHKRGYSNLIPPKLDPAHAVCSYVHKGGVIVGSYHTSQENAVHSEFGLIKGEGA